MNDFEVRIKKARQKRETLISLRAEKASELKAAKDKMQKLEDKALGNGFALEDLDVMIQTKEAELEKTLSEFETELQRVSSLLQS